MKVIRKSPYIALLLVVIVSIYGCKTLATTGFKVTATTATSVDTAMNIYGDFYRQGKISPAVEAKVKTAFTAYQTGMLATISSIRAYQAIADLSTASTADKQAAFNAATAALSDLSAKVVALIQLLTDAGVPSPAPSTAPPLTPTSPVTAFAVVK